MGSSSIWGSNNRCWLMGIGAGHQQWQRVKRADLPTTRAPFCLTRGTSSLIPPPISSPPSALVASPFMTIESAALAPAVGCLPSSSTTALLVDGSPAAASLYVVDFVFSVPEGLRDDVGGLKDKADSREGLNCLRQPRTLIRISTHIGGDTNGP